MKTRILEPSQILSVLFFKRGDITLLFPVSSTHNERAALFYYRWCRQMGNSTGSGDNEPAVQTVGFNVRSLFLILEPGGGKKKVRGDGGETFLLERPEARNKSTHVCFTSADNDRIH